MEKSVTLLLLSFGVLNIFYLLIFLPWYAHKKKLNLWRKPFSHLGDRTDTSRTFYKIMLAALVFQYLFFLGLITIIPVPMAAIFILTIATISGIFPAFFDSRNHFWIHTIFGLAMVIGSFTGGMIISLNSPTKLIGLAANVIMLIGFAYLYYEKFIKQRAPDFNCIGELIIFSGISLWNLIYFYYALSPLTSINR